MTESVQQLLNAFDALSEAERRIAASEVLRRIVASESGDVPDDGLTAAAEELFLELDEREKEDA
jgi:hypothetical protein